MKVKTLKTSNFLFFALSIFLCISSSNVYAQKKKKDKNKDKVEASAPAPKKNKEKSIKDLTKSSKEIDGLCKGYQVTFTGS